MSTLDELCVQARTMVTALRTERDAQFPDTYFQPFYGLDHVWTGDESRGTWWELTHRIRILLDGLKDREWDAENAKWFPIPIDEAKLAEAIEHAA